MRDLDLRHRPLLSPNTAREGEGRDYFPHLDGEGPETGDNHLKSQVKHQCWDTALGFLILNTADCIARGPTAAWGPSQPRRCPDHHPAPWVPHCGCTEASRDGASSSCYPHFGWAWDQALTEGQRETPGQ